MLSITALLVFAHAGCKPQENSSLVSTDINEPQQEGGKPQITFESTECDLGQISTGSTNFCSFNFKNTGDGTLKIARVQKTCGCTVVDLKKKQYAPGEEGTIKARYLAASYPGNIQKTLHVYSNDPNNQNVKLIIKAKIIQIINPTPARLTLFYNRPNAGCSKITLKSRDGKPFAITRISSTGNVLSAKFDPSGQ